MITFSIKDGKLVDAQGYRLPIAEAREILAAAVHTVQKSPLEDRRLMFAQKVAAWSHKNPGKYPRSYYAEFIGHWTSVNEFMGTEEMKVELTLKEAGKTGVFDIGRRLAYWWGKMDQAVKNNYWNIDEQNNPQPKQGTLL